MTFSAFLLPNQQCHSIDGIQSANLVQLYCHRGPLNHVHTYRLMQLCLYASTQQPNTMTSTIHQNNYFLLHENAQYFTDEILLSLYLLCIHTHTPSFNPGTWLSQFHNVKPIWVLPQQETMIEWQCATGTPGHANIQSDHQRQQTNTQFLPYLSGP